MIWYEIICMVFLIGMRSEAVAWICLLLMAIPPFFKFAFAWDKVIRRENRRYGAYIDDDGFYDFREW